MLRIAIILLLGLFPLSNFSQIKTLENSFELSGNYNKSKKEFYTNSILKSNLENYRLKEKDVTLHFEEGFDCVLLSAKSLFLKGINVNASNYEYSYRKGFIIPVFSITNDGFLLAKYEPYDGEKFKLNSNPNEK